MSKSAKSSIAHHPSPINKSPITHHKSPINKEWFLSWFDSPYYHILYQNHNEQDAKDFIDNLVANLAPQYQALFPTETAKILDLACGKGRHSRYMASKGFDVTGLDLSDSSIKFAQDFEADNLTFYQHDMRKSFRINYFDFILNIFTSFGYFEKEADNLTALKNVTAGLKPTGVFVLDYFNSNWVVENMKSEYTQRAGDIDFHIKKSVQNGHIIKKIAFHTEGVDFNFQEKVRLFFLSDFEKLFDKAGLKITDLFGDYKLNPFDEKTSNRLIIKAIQK